MNTVILQRRGLADAIKPLQVVGTEATLYVRNGKCTLVAWGRKGGVSVELAPKEVPPDMTFNLFLDAMAQIASRPLDAPVISLTYTDNKVEVITSGGGFKGWLLSPPLTKRQEAPPADTGGSPLIVESVVAFTQSLLSAQPMTKSETGKEDARLRNIRITPLPPAPVSVIEATNGFYYYCHRLATRGSWGEQRGSVSIPPEITATILRVLKGARGEVAISLGEQVVSLNCGAITYTFPDIGSQQFPNMKRVIGGHSIERASSETTFVVNRRRFVASIKYLEAFAQGRNLLTLDRNGHTLVLSIGDPGRTIPPATARIATLYDASEQVDGVDAFDFTTKIRLPFHQVRNAVKMVKGEKLIIGRRTPASPYIITNYEQNPQVWLMPLLGDMADRRENEDELWS